MRYKGSTKSLPEIARELQVDAVVEGAVLREGDRVRINARLIDASETQMWSDSYERELRDILSIQSDVASAIAREIRVKVAPEESTQLASKGPVDPDAYQAYLRGRVSFSRFTPESLAAAAREAGGISSGGRGERQEPDPDHRSLPPGHRRERRGCDRRTNTSPSGYFQSWLLRSPPRFPEKRKYSCRPVRPRRTRSASRNSAIELGEG